MRLTPVSSGDLDAALAELPRSRLVRADGRVFLTCAVEHTAEAQMLLARAGVRAEATATAPEPPRGAAPARALDLAPIVFTGVTDTVELRPIGIAEASAWMLRRGWLGRRTMGDGEVRALLRGDLRLIAWRRVLWADRAVFRARRLRGIRPIVFDRYAVDRGEERYTSSGAGAIAHWMRA